MLEPRLSSRSPSGKLHQFLVLLVAPVCLVVARIITPVLGAHGTLLLIAMIMFPLSQWLAGLAMRQYVVMIRLPAMLERKNGKPVVVIDDDRA